MRPKTKIAIEIAVLVVAVVLVVVGALTFLVPGWLFGSPSVTVTAVDWRWTGAPDCWQPTSGGGAHADGGSTFVFAINLSLPATFHGSCTVNSVATTTAGFVMLSSSTPLTVPSGGSGSLTVSLRAPEASFDGSVTLVGNVTGPS